jgi:putative tricarboxylic transport membrane protein
LWCSARCWLSRPSGGGWAADQEGTLSEWGSLGWVALGLVLNAALIEWIGFILASTIMFALVARGFGSGKWLRDGAIGFALALISYVGFDRILGYKIGTGLIEKLF